jgi:O-antigen/teichoic acid export membrane protein
MKRSGNSIRGALSRTFVQRAVSVIFTFGSVTIISRLLTPAEIGIFSIAMGFLALIQMLRDFGVTEFVIQEKSVSEPLVRTVFTMNLAIAWSLGVLVFASSGAVGRFYGDLGVAHVLRVMSLVFVLLPFGTTTLALMKRDMEFGKLARIRIGESVVRSCTAIGLAFAGFSYMSMAWAALAGVTTSVIGCVVWGWKYRVRGLGFDQWQRVVHFGSLQTVSDIAKTIGDQAPNLVVGRLLGLAPAGFFSRGFGIVNLYNSNVEMAISTVAFPAYAREHRSAGLAPELYLKSLVYITGISWPFFSAGILLAQPIIRLLFGPQWAVSVPLMRWLCAAALIGTLIYQSGKFLVALGRVSDATRLMLQYQLVGIALTVGAAFYSLQAVAAVQIVVNVVAAVLYFQSMRRYSALRFGSCAKALRPSALVAFTTCVAPAVVVGWPGFVDGHMLIALTIAILGGGLGWLLALVAVKHPLLDEIRRVTARIARVLPIKRVI